MLGVPIWSLSFDMKRTTKSENFLNPGRDFTRLMLGHNISDLTQVGGIADAIGNDANATLQDINEDGMLDLTPA